MKTPTVTLLALFVSLPAVKGQPTPTLPAADRIRIAEAFRLADAMGNRVWPGWDKAPFAVLLVTPQHEFLIRHPKPSADFTPMGTDALLKHPVWYRPRKYATNFEATFPAVGGIPTIVIGQAENTASKRSSRWVITLLHEHFHQLQEYPAGYYAAVNKLGLAPPGDQTGMWMLNYPFPYTAPAVNEQFSTLCRSLLEALQAREQPDFALKLSSYREARKKFHSLLKPDEWKYFAFQVWKEGIARYTEYKLAERAAAEYEPSKEFRELPDYTPFKEVARGLLEAMEKELRSVQLDKAKRTAVYNFGMAEGLLLDRASPTWRQHYFENRFSLDKYFDTAR